MDNEPIEFFNDYTPSAQAKNSADIHGLKLYEVAGYYFAFGYDCAVAETTPLKIQKA